MSVLIVDDDSKCNQIIDRAPRCLKKIISIREVRMATMQRARSRAIEIIRFDEIERAGAQKMFEEVVSLILYKLRSMLCSVMECSSRETSRQFCCTYVDQ